MGEMKAGQPPTVRKTEPEEGSSGGVLCGAQTPDPGAGPSWEEDSDGASWEQAWGPSVLLGPALGLLEIHW